MSNPLDNKIKESLENFEMPYDAGAWAQLAEQLPAAGGAASGGSQFGWKAVAVIAVLVTTVATAWYMSDTKEIAESEPAPIEKTEKVADKKKDAPVEVSINSKEEATDEVAVEQTPVKSEQNLAEVSNKKSITEPAEIKAEQLADEAKSIEPAHEDTQVAPSEKPNQVETIPAVEEKQLVAKFLPSLLTICVGEDISFINESSDKSATMNWSFGDGTSKSESDPVHSFVLPGNYLVSLKADNGSKTSDYTVNVTVNPTPRPIFSAERKLDGYVAIPLYRFTTAVQPSETAVWSFSDGTRIIGNSANHLFRNEGTSTAKLTVTNDYGCSNTMDEKYDLAKDFDLLAPNTFSPNADGFNEAFMPAALPEMGVGFEMNITNPRTGQVVYRTSNASEPWNGKQNNANPKLESGVYIWTVILKENVVENRVFNGKINLNR
jgi:gliding motility-associated-like protein